MSVFTNKHVVVALLIAPILAVLAWFAVGQIVGEKPHVAQAGGIYPLVAQSGCRWESGACELHNQDVRLHITMGSNNTLALTASHSLNGVQLGVGDANSASPEPMQRADSDGLAWSLVSPVIAPGDHIYLVADIAGAKYWADVPTVFLFAKEASNE